jgi:DNA-binding protein YbaB
MNIKKMMQQAQKMQEQMLKAQEDVSKKLVTATAGGGKGDRRGQWRRRRGFH